MSYHTKDFRGEAHAPFRCSDSASDTLQFLTQSLPGAFQKKNIPAKVYIGIVINGQALSVPLLGYSAENTRANKKAVATGLKSLLTPSADEFALQEEELWERDVIETILSLYDFH